MHLLPLGICAWILSVHAFHDYTTDAQNNLNQGGHLLLPLVVQSQEREAVQDDLALLQSFLSIQSKIESGGSQHPNSTDVVARAFPESRTSGRALSVARSSLRSSHVDPALLRPHDGLRTKLKRLARSIANVLSVKRPIELSTAGTKSVSLVAGASNQSGAPGNALFVATPRYVDPAPFAAHHGLDMRLAGTPVSLNRSTSTHFYQLFKHRHAHRVDSTSRATEQHQGNSRQHAHRVTAHIATGDSLFDAIMIALWLTLGLKGTLTLIGIVLFIGLHFWLCLAPERPRTLRVSAPATSIHVASASTVADPEADGKEDEQEAVRMCYVCMSRRIETVAIPCRHSSMCQQCMREVLSSNSLCPLCRAHISYSVYGLFDSDYVDLAGRLVEVVSGQAHDKRLDMYEGMFERIRGLVVLGIVAALFSLTLFLLLPERWPALLLAVYAVLVGYLPWFAVTVVAFERDDKSVRARFFSDEDPVFKAVGKALLFVLVAPIAIVVFFLPYGIFALIVRPFFTKVLPFVIFCLLAVVFFIVLNFWLYFVHPLGTCLRMLGSALMTFVFRPLGRGIVNTYRFCYTCVLSIWEGLTAIASACGHAISAVWEFTLAYVLTPIGHGIHHALDAFFDYVLVPLGYAIQYFCHGLGIVLHAIGRGVSACATAFYGYVLAPIGQGIHISAIAFYTYVVVPVKQGVTATASAFYLYVLMPIATGTLVCLKAVGDGIVMVVVGFYSSILVPIGLGLQAIWRAIANGMTNVFLALYAYVLAPLGSGINYVATAVYNGLAYLSLMVYVYALVPLGNGIASAATAVYESVLRPAAIGISDAFSATATAVSNVASAIASSIQDAFHAFV
mmetsp:Transcript_99140/g.171958  ORF Transcript_99140/g.171958 Transcript_99140/m.171958 type:complete len:847 (-) Transcript_99140:33-2573(-)